MIIKNSKPGRFVDSDKLLEMHMYMLVEVSIAT